MTSTPKILVVYKHSTYEFLRPVLRGSIADRQRFLSSHKRHYATLAAVEKNLRQSRLGFHKIPRGKKVKYSDYNFVITVGGDGTFLETARHLKNQLILGVNSDPRYSVGRFCAANTDTFAAILFKILKGRAPIQCLQRLQIKHKGGNFQIPALNDILVCHQNPAAMSHYYLQIGSVREEQRSSGVWISTAAGSTGGIHSSGGEILPVTSCKFEYWPRELYCGWKKSYRLTGAVLNSRQTVTIQSLMREGMVFLDGAHNRQPISFSQKLMISLSPYPLNVVVPK